MLEAVGLGNRVPYVVRNPCLRQIWQATNALSASVFAATCLVAPNQGQRQRQGGCLLSMWPREAAAKSAACGLRHNYKLQYG